MDQPHPVQRRIINLNSGNFAVVVSINRPDNLNCFNTEVLCLLSKIFAEIAESIDNDAEAPSAVIFTGEGNSFCAGADLSNPPNPIYQSSDLPEYLRNNPVYQMGRIGIPIIGALKGNVITGGMELALSCDILVGDKTTKFRDTHVKFGLAPCWGLSQKLQRRVGPGRAKIISLSAKPIDADLAIQWGLLDELVHDGRSSLEHAINIANTIAKQDKTMVRRYKRALEEGGSMDLASGLRRERELGIAHYIEVLNDGKTFNSAKAYIVDEKRPRNKSKL